MSRKNRKLSEARKAKVRTESRTETAIDREATEELIERIPFVERMYGGYAGWLVIAILCLGCVAIYYQVFSFDFINFDDNVYVYTNDRVLGGLSLESLSWALSSYRAANWHPVTWISHLTDVSLFGLNPGYHHLTNVVFHTLNSVLLFGLLRLLTGSVWRSGIAAAIFAFHPAHVESVAWVAERKDVVSTMFALLCIGAYVYYVRSERRTAWYIAVVVLFALGLMSKPMVVTLPFLLMLLDYWPLSRLEPVTWRRASSLLVEKIPLLAMSAVSSYITILAQGAGGAIVPLTHLDYSTRFTNALISYVTYIWMFFVPLDLAGFYQLPLDQPFLKIAGSGALLVGITALVFVWRRRAPYAVVGWLWFVGTLVPVIGLVQVGAQAYADRYTYLPYIGLAILVVWGVGALVTQKKINLDLVSASVLLVMVGLSAVAFKQTSYWRTTEVFYERALAVTGGSFLFEQNYCQYLLERDRLDEAEQHCRNALTFKPDYVNALVSLGVVQMKRGDYKAAAENFEAAHNRDPSNLRTYANVISSLIVLGRLDEAADHLQRIETSTVSDELRVYLFPLYKLLGYSYGNAGRIDLGIRYMTEAKRIDGSSAEVRNELGRLLLVDGKQTEALAEYLEASKLDPSRPETFELIGRIYLKQGKKAEAIDNLEAALRLEPGRKTAADALDKARKL